jgi:hypothetical protein
MDQFRVARAVFAGLASVTLAAFLSVPVVAHAEACVNGTVQRGGSGGDYFLCQGGAWLHVVPTLDPHSADGYGPNQPLPPKCARFPDQYNCPIDGPPPDLGSTGY